ncbi:MAG: zinc ABC transporter substrate-binding protein [Bacteroidales bacterium]|jgi:zinc transport system substrate-binding protein|nr:zinc ABC transporter substrate-binding protein [Bacteroidales bacterium]
MKGRYLFILIAALLLHSCGTGRSHDDKEVISVSIGPLKYFAAAITGEEYEINIMVPPSADPHHYEPTMEQLQGLRRSVAYIGNGHLDFELSWLYRFYQVNPEMKIITFANNQDLIFANAWQHDDHWHYEGVDPHFWISPKAAYRMASDTRDLFVAMKPEAADRYEENYRKLVSEITALDRELMDTMAPYAGRHFMIYHPVLGYLARDYGLVQVPVEFEGKEPSPASLMETITRAKELNIKVIFVQQEFDTKNATAIASETGAQVVTINPLSENWPAAVREISAALTGSFQENR